MNTVIAFGIHTSFLYDWFYLFYFNLHHSIFYFSSTNIFQLLNENQTYTHRYNPVLILFVIRCLNVCSIKNIDFPRNVIASTFVIIIISIKQTKFIGLKIEIASSIERFFYLRSQSFDKFFMMIIRITIAFIFFVLNTILKIFIIF